MALMSPVDEVRTRKNTQEEIFKLVRYLNLDSITVARQSKEREVQGSIPALKIFLLNINDTSYRHFKYDGYFDIIAVMALDLEIKS